MNNKPNSSIEIMKRCAFTYQSYPWQDGLIWLASHVGWLQDEIKDLKKRIKKLEKQKYNSSKE